MDFNSATPQQEPSPPEIPDPNLETIADYMDLVFGYCEGWIPFRSFADIGQDLDARPHAIWVEADEMDELAATKEKAATFARWATRESMAFYVIPGTVAKQKQAKASDIIQTQVILVDLDSGDINAKLEHLTIHMGEPTAIIESGGITKEGQQKLHAYWKLSEAAEKEDVALACRIRYQLALKVGGDPHFQSAHQPIRVAGSVYHKHGRHRLVSFRTLNTMEYHLSDMAEAVNDMPTMDGIDLSGMDFNDAGASKPTIPDILTNPVREGDQDEWSRFTGASAAIGHYIRLAHSGQMSRDEAWEAISQYNAAMLQPPWSMDRLAAEAQRLWGKHCDKNGSGAVALATDKPLQTYRLADLLADDSPMPDDLISPRLLTPNGMLIIGGAPKVGKSDFLIHLLVHMASGLEFLGFAPPRPLNVFYLQAEIQYDYLRERMKQMGFSQEMLSQASNRLVLTPKVRMMLNENGVARTIATIRRDFTDDPPDIICIDPLRNLFDGGQLGGGENDNDAMMFFLQERVERIRDAVNPEAGIIICHNTKKLNKKQLMEDPFQALSGAGSLRSYYTSGMIIYRQEETQPERMLNFELRNGPAIGPMKINKEKGEWMKVTNHSERLVGQSIGEKQDAERDRKREVIIGLILDESIEGRVYTPSQFAETFENQAGLGGRDNIVKRISVATTKGEIKFFRNYKDYNLPAAIRSKHGYMCAEGMDFLMDDGELVALLPTHFKSVPSGATLPVENPEVWVYQGKIHNDQ